MASLNLNVAVLSGRLTADPELRTTTGGKSVTSFTVAINRKYNSGSEQQTDFVNCTAWGKTAEFVSKYFSKGQSICVEGSIQSRSWEKDGKKNYATVILVNEAHFVDDKQKSGQSAEQTVSREAADPAQQDGSDELPF